MITDIIEESGRAPESGPIEEVVCRFYSENKMNPEQKLTIVFLDDEGIREYKRQMFGIDEPTDVISMLVEEDFDGEYIWGEIYVSSETALNESEKRGNSFEEEIMLYVVHGLFHLIGFDDGTKQDRQNMWDAQLAFLDRCGFSSGSFNGGA